MSQKFLPNDYIFYRKNGRLSILEFTDDYTQWKKLAKQVGKSFNPKVLNNEVESLETFAIWKLRRIRFKCTNKNLLSK